MRFQSRISMRITSGCGLLSKSQFLEGISCGKKLWLAQNRAELKPPVKESDRRRMEVGREIGSRARSLFPTGVIAPYVGLTDCDAFAATLALMATDVGVIFEATFLRNDLVVRSDVVRREGNAWRILEVKSASEYDKTRHLPDLAFQTYVAREAGVDISGGSLIHLSKEFRSGQPPENLFKTVSLDSEIENALPAINRQVEMLRTLLLDSEILASDPCPNSACRGCDFSNHCLPQLPADHLYFTGIHHSKQKNLKQLGINRSIEIPVDFDLTPAETMKVAALLTGKPQISPDLTDRLAGLEYPLYFIDFESISPEIPLFPGTRPYEVIPFQWSCHVVASAEALALDQFTHHEFIHKETTDPRPAFAASLFQVLGSTGTILHYSNFEIQVVRQLNNTGIEFGNDLLSMVEPRFTDLEVLVKNGFADPRMQGRSSIKRVLPALDCPHSYKTLEIQDGDMAITAYLRTYLPECRSDEKEEIFKNLLLYCGLDTYAMVYVLQKLFHFSRFG